MNAIYLGNCWILSFSCQKQFILLKHYNSYALVWGLPVESHERASWTSDTVATLTCRTWLLIDGSTSLEERRRSSCGPVVGETHADVINVRETLLPLMTSPGAALHTSGHFGRKRQNFLWGLLSDWSHVVIREVSPLNFATIWNPWLWRQSNGLYH